MILNFIKILRHIFFTFLIINFIDNKGNFENDSIYHLILNIVPKGKILEDLKIPISIYYKGLSFKQLFSSKIGCQINISESNVIEDLYIAVCKKMDTVNLYEGSPIVKGFKMNDKESDLYHISIIIIKALDGSMSYKWNIEKVKSFNKCLPENTIFLQMDPNYVKIENFDSDFTPKYPQKIENSKFVNILFLPEIFINVENLNDIQKNVILNPDIKAFHVEAESIIK